MDLYGVRTIRRNLSAATSLVLTAAELSKLDPRFCSSTASRSIHQQIRNGCPEHQELWPRPLESSRWITSPPRSIDRKHSSTPNISTQLTTRIAMSGAAPFTLDGHRNSTTLESRLHILQHRYNPTRTSTSTRSPRNHLQLPPNGALTLYPIPSQPAPPPLTPRHPPPGCNLRSGWNSAGHRQHEMAKRSARQHSQDTAPERLRPRSPRRQKESHAPRRGRRIRPQASRFLHEATAQDL